MDADQHAPRPAQLRVQPCDLHPSWQPIVDGRMSPPKHMCPYCKQDAEGNRPSRVPEERRVRDHDPTTPLQYQIAEAFYEKHPEKRPGGLLSETERDRLVEMADAARAAEREREQSRGRRQGRLVSGRIEHGVWIEWRDVPGVGLVRVSPEGVS